MEAWVVTEYGQPLEHVELPTPQPEGTQVRVAVEYCGLCHSDLHTWEGKTNLGRRGVMQRPKGLWPLAIGHEIIGRVTAMGPDAKDVKIGDRRIVYPWLGCGACRDCHTGRDNMCAVEGRGIGFRQHGGFAGEVMVPHERYLIDPGELDPALAATYACSGITVLSAVRKLLPLPEGEPLVMIGAGGLGLQAIAMARALGHTNIIVVENSEAKREAALAEGAATFVVASGEGATAMVLKAAGGKVMAVLDLVNSSDTALMAFDLLRKGGKMVQVGLFGGELVAPLPLLTTQAITVQGTLTGTVQDLKDVVALAREGKLRAMPITELPRAEANAAIQRLVAGQVKGRLVLRAEGVAPPG